jgi:hypothetical protein
VIDLWKQREMVAEAAVARRPQAANLMPEVDPVRREQRERRKLRHATALHYLEEAPRRPGSGAGGFAPQTST